MNQHLFVAKPNCLFAACCFLLGPTPRLHGGGRGGFKLFLVIDQLQRSTEILLCTVVCVKCDATIPSTFPIVPKSPINSLPAGIHTHTTTPTTTTW
jgi:hypothetical protein